VNGEVHGGRPRPTGAVVPRKKKKKNIVQCTCPCEGNITEEHPCLLNKTAVMGFLIPTIYIENII
jgi:hypothetical protein